ncbi:MAG: uroporphyrinogen-III C-methyltransferase [Acidimicrobiales bacterium]
MTVYLVGAGPGDPGLITRRGAQVLAQADVVVIDRLAEAALLDLARGDVEVIDVGKRPGGGAQQDEINALLVERGRAGQTVVRLKGGDPFVFGRGGEEALALQEAGVDFEVVPGVTAAVAVPAYAGVPVTHRGVSAAFTVVTGHPHRAIDGDIDIEALARLGGTIVVLMGVARRAEIAARLIEAGMGGDTPVLAVRWGTRAEQFSVRTTLADLGQAPVEAPATIVIGAVAGLDLAWFGGGDHTAALASGQDLASGQGRRPSRAGPLSGWRVVVTRSASQAPGLSRRLKAAGADPVEVALVDLVDPADGGIELAQAARRAGSYDWVVFTSGYAVERFITHLVDARGFGLARVAAVGPGTARVLAEFGVRADLVPERFVAEELVAAFPDPGPGGGRVLVPCSARSRPALAQGLKDKGWAVQVVHAYQPVPVALGPAQVDQIKHAQAVTLTSASGAHALADALDTLGWSPWPEGERNETSVFQPAIGAHLEPAEAQLGTVEAQPRTEAAQFGPGLVCIGPLTAQAATQRCLPVTAMAQVHTLDGLVEALVSLRKLSL